MFQKNCLGTSRIHEIKKYLAFYEHTMMSLNVDVMFYFTITACPLGWVYGRTKCFLIVNQLPKFDGTTARGFCDGLKAVAIGNGEMFEPTLLFIENVEEFDLLQPHVKGKWIWISCNFLKKMMCFTDRAGDNK